MVQVQLEVLQEFDHRNGCPACLEWGGGEGMVARCSADHMVLKCEIRLEKIMSAVT